MRSFLRQYGKDLQVMAELQGLLNKEQLKKLRERIDRMFNQNVRQAALLMWAAKEHARTR